MKVTKLLQRSTSLLLALAMLLSFLPGVYSEGTGTDSEQAPEILEGYVWRTLSVEIAPFEEEQEPEKEAEAARWAEKVTDAAHFLELMLSHVAETEEDEDAPVPTIEVRGWMPEDVTARAELISYAEEDLYKELALAQAEIRFYDAEGQSWCPTYPLTVCLDGDVLEEVRAAKMDPTVYVYREEPRDEKKPEEQLFTVEAYSAVRSADEVKTYERELGEDVRAEVRETALTKVEEAPKAVCFETESEAVRFVLTARQPDRSYTAVEENGEAELAIVGNLPRGLSASVAAASVETESDVLPGDVVLAWDLSLTHPDYADYQADATVKVALRDSALAELKRDEWDLQLWQLREGADPVRVKDAAFKDENLRFSASELSTFVVVQVAIEKRLTATDGSSYSVQVTYDSHAGIPAGTELVVREITPDDASYADYLAKSVSSVNRKASDFDFVRLFDITLRDPETGVEYQPTQDVKVKIDLLSEDLSECAQVNVVHFGQQTEVMGSDVKGDAVAFQTSGFSVYAVMGVAIERTITAADGSTYEISVSYDKSAGIPAGAELQVRELTGAEYMDYLAKTATFLSREEEQLVFTRFFDITIVKDGVVYEPNNAVNVSIRLLNHPETQGVLRVVHFGEEKTELLENKVAADGTLQFATESFSVYAITDEDGNVIVPRAFYHFYDDEIDMGRQIIKNQGVLVEPDHNEASNHAFLGWYVYDPETKAWGEQVEFDKPIQVIFGNEAAVYGNSVVVPKKKDENGKWINHIDVTVKTRYTANFATIYYMSADENISSTATVGTATVPMPVGQDSTVFEIPDALNWDFANNGNYIFVGWSNEKPQIEYKLDNGRWKQYYNYYTNNDHRTPLTTLTVRKDQNQNNNNAVYLYPVFKEAHWLIFKTGPVGSGAEYVRPVYVLNSETANGKQPADPTWRGYKFLYWTTTPTFDSETGTLVDFSNGAPPRFNFNQKLSADTTLYAYWESGYTTYTVITWQQNVKNGWNFAANKRTYEFYSQETREAKVGEIVNLTDADKNQVFNGFHHKTEQGANDGQVDSKNVTVASSGESVLNVFYDREIMKMQFFDDDSLEEPSGKFNDSRWDEPNSKIVTTWMGLYGQPLYDGEINFYTWPEGTWQYYSNPAQNETMGMSYLGQFVFPDHEIGNVFRAYRTGYSGQSTIYMYRQDKNGGYDDPDLWDSGEVKSGGTFNFSEKYDGYMVAQYRRFYVGKDGAKHYVDADGNAVSNPDDAWAPTTAGQTTPLSSKVYTGDPNDYMWYYSGGGETVYADTTYTGTRDEDTNRYNNPIMTYNGNGNYSFTGYNSYWGARYYVLKWIREVQPNENVDHYAAVNFSSFTGFVKCNKEKGYLSTKLNLDIRYARRSYSISYYDSMDGQSITALLKDGTTVQRKNGVLYGSNIEAFYPDSSFEPVSKELGWDFNGRWYSDLAKTTQIFFHDKPLTKDEEAKLYYYQDLSGEKIYINRKPTTAEWSMTLADDGRVYGQDEPECIGTSMPNRNLALYAGFTHTWYWIKIDPNGGYLNGNDPDKDHDSTYFWEQYGKIIEEYQTARPFVEDPVGTWYYHYDEFDTTDPTGVQTTTRKAYYTQNAKESTDDKTYRKVEEDDQDGYTFAGWYSVDSSSGTDKYTKYSFANSFVTGNLLLRAMWKQKGEYRVYYSNEKALDANGNVIEKVTVGGTPPTDEYKYARESPVVVQSGVMQAINVDSSSDKEYDFIGWYVGNGVYAAGDVFFADPVLVERWPGSDENAPYDTFILYPVFRDKDAGNGNNGRTTLILDANGGKKTPDYKDLPVYAYYNAKGDKVYYSETVSTSTDDSTGLSLNMDAELPLPEDQDGKNVFYRDNAEFLGWAFSRDAKTPAFKAGQIVGVDNDTGNGFNGQNGNVLYAVWHQTEIPVQFRLLDADSSAPIAGGTFSLLDSANAAVAGTAGGITSGSDGYLAKGTTLKFNVKTPSKVDEYTYFTLNETDPASGYIPLSGPVTVKVDYYGTVTYRYDGDTKDQNATAISGASLIVVKEHLAICKVVNGGEETLFSNLNDAVAFAKTQDGSSSIQMMVDYVIPSSDFVTISEGDDVILTTASKTGKNPYRGEGETATITRGDSGTSMFTVNGGEFVISNIVLDGGSTANKACNSDGGIVRVTGGSLAFEEGVTLRNSNVVEGNGGAIAAIGSDAYVEVYGDTVFENCSAKQSGGAIYVADKAAIDVDGASFTNCTAQAEKNKNTNGGGAIAVRNGSNNTSEPDAVIRNVTIENCGTDGIGGAILVYGAAAVVEESRIGKQGGTGGCTAASGGGIAVTNGSKLSLTDTEIYGCSASDMGGAIFDYQSNVTLDGTTITTNTAPTGAGVYVSAKATLSISGDPNFGGPGVSQDGTLNGYVGNFAGALTEQTNGQADYPKARQDIYLAEKDQDPASLVITDNLTGKPGSIWVWAESENHYEMVKPFAVIDSSSEIKADTYAVFRNAREDSVTLCAGDYLTGQTGANAAFVYWTGGLDVKFIKIDGYNKQLPDAEFTLYSGIECTDAQVCMRKDKAISASSDGGGVVTFEKLNPNIVFMKETAAPTGCKLDEDAKYVILVGEANLTVPDTRTDLWATVLKDITQADIDAQISANKDRFDLDEYAIFAIDKDGHATTTRSIAEQGILNVSDKTCQVILSKINTGLERLPGAKFILRSIDGTVILQNDMPEGVEEYESDDSGVFFAGRLPYGIYYLEETVAPKLDPDDASSASYVKPTHYFVFEVSAEGVKSWRKADDGSFSFEATNTVVEPTDPTYVIPANP